MSDTVNKTIVVGTGDIVFHPDRIGNMIVRQIEPPGIPGERVPKECNEIMSVVISYNKNFHDLCTECKHLLESRKTGDDMTSYYAGGDLMLGEWAIKFHDMSFNQGSIRVLVEALKCAMSNYCVLCAV